MLLHNISVAQAQVSFLHTLPLFAGLTPEECRELEQRMEHREFPPQSIIIREGGPGNAAFFIQSGSVAVRRKDPASGIEFQLAESVEPFLVSASTVGVIVQRLARRLCPARKEPYDADAAASGYFGLPPGITLDRVRSCNECGGKGVKGRIGVYEVLKMNTELRGLVSRASRAEDIHAAAIAHGMLDLKRYSALLLTEGLTSVEEVMSVVSVEE